MLQDFLVCSLQVSSVSLFSLVRSGSQRREHTTGNTKICEIHFRFHSFYILFPFQYSEVQLAPALKVAFLSWPDSSLLPYKTH